MGQLPFCWGIIRGVSATCFETPLIGGSRLFVGGLGAPLPHPGFPLGETGKGGSVRYLAAS
jgi:hypothetical protein